jgi:hypothetical protein
VKTAPLRACAQFLNVIESVFSGMAKAIIHNSYYPSVEAAKNAINRHFKERNDFFLQNPKRAGQKIWGQERVPSELSEANNCKIRCIADSPNVAASSEFCLVMSFSASSLGLRLTPTMGARMRISVCDAAGALRALL